MPVFLPCIVNVTSHLACRFPRDVITITQQERLRAGGIGLSLPGCSLQHGWTCASLGLFISSVRRSGKPLLTSESSSQSSQTCRALFSPSLFAWNDARPTSGVRSRPLTSGRRLSLAGGDRGSPFVLSVGLFFCAI